MQLKSACSGDVFSRSPACFDGHMGVQREGFCSSPLMCPKRLKKKPMTHHILFFVGTNEGSFSEVTEEFVIPKRGLFELMFNCSNTRMNN